MTSGQELHNTDPCFMRSHFSWNRVITGMNTHTGTQTHARTHAQLRVSTETKNWEICRKWAAQKHSLNHQQNILQLVMFVIFLVLLGKIALQRLCPSGKMWRRVASNNLLQLAEASLAATSNSLLTWGLFHPLEKSKIVNTFRFFCASFLLN